MYTTLYFKSWTFPLQWPWKKKNSDDLEIYLNFPNGFVTPLSSPFLRIKKLVYNSIVLYFKTDTNQKEKNWQAEEEMCCSDSVS